MGSLYFLELWGSDEEGGGDNPRTINAKSRLYSPYGLGGSVEFSYDYHYRQFRANERFSTFVAMTRGIGECNPKDPAYCSTTEKNKNGRRKPSEGSIKIFDMNGAKISGTTAKNYEDIEESLFGSTGWLSPLKLFHLACAAGTVMLYHENNAGTVAKAGLDKFKFFQGESDGKGKVQEDIRLLADLEKKEDEPVCVPSRLLLLAKQSG
ncbi:hypothetical protein DFH07DRAFT_559280 [Mycena maculata]|uniref:Uncharacterized protein n=1 Tax=Mycena maculata TaxID=230809 RepID=A0AAD7N7B0_9AGAR|nr:hypothetical protein DFH07DRAFT_559280 [Mycena maculata]